MQSRGHHFVTAFAAAVRLSLGRQVLAHVGERLQALSRQHDHRDGPALDVTHDMHGLVVAESAHPAAFEPKPGLPLGRTAHRKTGSGSQGLLKFLHRLALHLGLPATADVELVLRGGQLRELAAGVVA